MSPARELEPGLKLAIARKRPGRLRGATAAIRAAVGRSGDTDAERAFAAAFATFVEAPHAVCVAGARAGLWHILRWLAETQGTGEVVLPGLTASIVPNVVHAAGFEVRFVDVDPETFTTPAEALVAATNDRTRLVVATHLEGFPMRVDRVIEALAGRSTFVLEDAAHACGSRVSGQAVGSIGHAAIFSLGKGKQINAIRGGIVSTRVAELDAYLQDAVASAANPAPLDVLKDIAMVQAMRMATRPGVFDATLWPGLQIAARMGRDPLTETFGDALQPPGAEGPSAVLQRLGPAQAILGKASLAAYPRDLDRRQALWTRLRDSALEGGVALQRAEPGTTAAPLEFVVRVRDRAAAQAALRKLGVDSQATWMMAPSQLPAFADRDAAALPVSEALARELLYVPFYPALREAEVARLGKLLRNPPRALVWGER